MEKDKTYRHIVRIELETDDRMKAAELVGELEKVADKYGAKVAEASSFPMQVPSGGRF